MLECSCFAQAETYLQKSLDITRKQGITERGEASFNYAENSKNLALVRIADGKLAEAVELASRAAENRTIQHSAATLAFRDTPCSTQDSWTPRSKSTRRCERRRLVRTRSILCIAIMPAQSFCRPWDGLKMLSRRFVSLLLV